MDLRLCVDRDRWLNPRHYSSAGYRVSLERSEIRHASGKAIPLLRCTVVAVVRWGSLRPPMGSLNTTRYLLAYYLRERNPHWYCLRIEAEYSSSLAVLYVGRFPVVCDPLVGSLPPYRKFSYTYK